MAPRKSHSKSRKSPSSRPRSRETPSRNSSNRAPDESATMRKVFMGVLVLLFVAGVSYLIYDRVNNGSSETNTTAPGVGVGGGASPSPTPAPNQCTMERVTSGGQVDVDNSTKAYIVSANLDESVGCQYESQLCSALLGSSEQACKDACAKSSECQFVRFTGDGIKCTFFADVIMTGSGAPSEPVFRKGPMCST